MLYEVITGRGKGKLPRGEIHGNRRIQPGEGLENLVDFRGLKLGGDQAAVIHVLPENAREDADSVGDGRRQAGLSHRFQKVAGENDVRPAVGSDDARNNFV